MINRDFAARKTRTPCKVTMQTENTVPDISKINRWLPIILGRGGKHRVVLCVYLPICEKHN
uniref:Uncharacterized protein n=1 Tax=Arundo donax TaxID=35708 RepID=A0A0A9F1Y3_ARUDO